MRINEFLKNFDSSKIRKLHDGSFLVPCPSHNDKIPSLHISEKEEHILIKCQAGCETQDVLNVMGLTFNDLFTMSNTKKADTIVATYDYKDEDGKDLFQVVRFDPKAFSQRHKNGKGNWVWDMKGVRRVLYHLPEITITLPNERVYWVEGEKDCDNLWGWGLIATTSPGGANAFKPEYSKPLEHRAVTIIPDNDPAGYSYAREVARSLIGKSSLKCILLEKVRDVSEWLEQNDSEILSSLEQDISALLDSDKPKYEAQDEEIIWNKIVSDRTITFKAESLREEKTGVHGRISIFCDYSPLAWGLFNIERSEDRVRLANSAHKQLKGDISKSYANEDVKKDLDAFCLDLWDFYNKTLSPEIMAGDEDDTPINYFLKPFVIEGGGTILFAPPGRGKSGCSLIWAVSIHQGINKFWQVQKCPVLFINLERSKQSISRRLAKVNELLGLPPSTKLPVLNARGKSLAQVISTCKRFIKQHDIKLIVLDSISRAGYGDLTDNRPVNIIIDSLSNLCDSWLALGHTPRQDENHIFGGIHFDAGADIVVQLASEIKDDGTLGIGLQTVKANDIPLGSQEIWAMEFTEMGISNLRRANQFEFPKVEGKRREDSLTILIEYISNLDTGDATATQASEDISVPRPQIVKLFKHSGRFLETRREGRSVYYGVKREDS